MAQLNDLIVTGSSRFLNKIQGTAVKADLADSATTAARLNNTAAVGGAGTPTYFNANGVPAACTLSSIYVGRATADESGNNIKTNYASSLSISDHTITLKSKSGANLASVTVPDNDTTYSLGTSGQYMQLIPDSGDRISVVPNFAMQSARRIFVQGTQTAPTTGGAWTGNCPEILTANALTDGQEITYWVPLPTTGNVTLNLTFGDGTSSGAVNCYYGGTSRLTTHYGQGQAVHLTYRKDVKIPSTGSTTYTGWWADANYDSNSNTIDVLQGTYTIPVAGGSIDFGQTTTIGVHKYSLFARDILTGKYASFTNTSGTGNKAEAGCMYDISSIMYANSSSDIAANGNISTSIVRYAHPLVDFRYTLNITKSSFTARKPLYLIFYAMPTAMMGYADEVSIIAAPLANSGNGIIWTQDLDTYNPPSGVPADELIAIEICRAVYDGYRGDLAIKPVFYVFRDSPAFGNKWVPLTSLTALYASTAKVANKTTGTLTLQVKGTTKATFNGNTTTFNVTTSDLGIGTAGLKASADFAAASHGIHVPATVAATNKKYLLCNNTWATITSADVTSFSNAVAGVTVNNATNASKVSGTAFGSAATCGRETFVSDVEYDQSLGILTVTKYNASEKSYISRLSSVPLSGKYATIKVHPYDNTVACAGRIIRNRTTADATAGQEFGILDTYNTYAVDLNIALTQQSSPFVFTVEITYPTTMYSAPMFIYLVPRDKSTGANSRVCYNNGYGIDRQPTNFPASSWTTGKTSGMHQLQAAAGNAGTAYVTAIIGWR